MKKLIIMAFISSSCFAADPQQNDWAAWDAKQYDENSKQQYKASLEHLEKHKELISNAKLVVELGSNTANVARHLAEHNPDVTFVGIDPEKDAIAYAKDKHADLENLRLICAPAQTFNLQEDNLPLANLIACYHVLHWIPRDQLPKVFENIAANLAPHGILDLSCSAKQETRGVTKAVRWTLLKPTWWWHATRKFIGEAIQGESKLTLLTLQELQQYATNAGLQVDQCKEGEFSCSFETKDEFAEWMRAILKPHGIDKMDQEQQRPFINAVVDKYCDDYNTEEAKQKGTIEYRFTILKLIAHKLAENKADAE